MLVFNDLGLLNGEYVALSIETLQAACQATPSAQDGRDVEACKAFEGLLDVSQYIPDSQEYEDFKTAVYNRLPELNLTQEETGDVSALFKCQTCTCFFMISIKVKWNLQIQCTFWHI